MNRSLLILAYVGLLALVSCMGAITSENENKGVKDVANFFGGHISFGINTNYSSDKGKQTDVTLELNNSDFAEQFKDKPGLCASGAAYIFYNDLEDEKKSINTIKVAINYKDGSSITQSFPNTQLDSVISNKKIYIDFAVDCLKQKKYREICNMVVKDTAIWNPGNDRLMQGLQKSDSIFGSVKEFQLYGYKIYHRDYGTEIMYAGGLMCDKKNTKFIMAVFPGSKNGPVTFVDFNY